MIDLRSDFLSSPTPAMLDAMRTVAGHDKGYGPRDDPQQRLLEQTAADLLGKDDALFVPTCMMANLLAVMAAAKRGDAVVLDSDSHVLNGESGALAAIAGVVTLPLPASRGRIPLEALAACLESGTLQQPRTSVVMMENTHNRAGGVAVGADYYADVRRCIGDRWLHLDGSRIFNAAVALAESPAALVRSADSVAVSLNKGLAAPAGALLAGPVGFIAEATRLRQQLGGGWRPVGMLASAALIGLKSMGARLADDHRHARLLALTLARCQRVTVDLASVQTNIVRARLDCSRIEPRGFQAALETEGVRIRIGDDGAFRLVTYVDITQEMTTHVCAVLTALLSGSGTDIDEEDVQ